MFTFLFCAGDARSSRRVNEPNLEALAQRAMRVTPTLGPGLEYRVRCIPEVNCGWCLILPREARDGALVTEATSDRFAVVAFGDLVRRAKPCAQQILEAWPKVTRRRSMDAEGCYSAVVVDRTDRSFVMLGDPIGQRVLHYYKSVEWLVASPHDVCLAATGMVPVKYDLITTGSIASVEWSLNGKSLLMDVDTVSPRRWIQVRDWKFDVVPISIADPGDRIDRRDTKGLVSNRDQIVRTLRDDVAAFVADESDIKIELTAGIDSRAVVALLLSVVQPERVTAITGGEAGDLDVRIARKISQRLGIDCEYQMPPRMAMDDFDAYCDLIAFCCNGDATSLVATTNSMPTDQRRPPITLAGNGGETYRGYYYPFQWHRRADSMSRQDVLALLDKKCRFERIPWSSDEHADGVRQRLASTLDDLSQISGDPYDLLDLFYLYERFGVWAARSRRCFWNPLRWSPFSSRAVAGLAYQRPSPLGDVPFIHAEVVRRYAPSTYHLAINNEDFLRLMDGGLLSKGISKSIQLCNKMHRRYRSKLKFTVKESPIGDLRSNYFSHYLNESQWQSFDEHRSITARLVGERNLKQIIEEQRSGLRDHSQLLGSLLTVEHWRIQVESAVRLPLPAVEL